MKVLENLETGSNASRGAANGSAHPKVLCILPAYNEEGKIGKVVKKVRAVGRVDQIVVVDDCSNDNTKREAIEAGATVLRHEVNKGVGAGIRTGLQYGLDNNYDVAVIMSGDDQHEPKELPSVLEKLFENRSNFVQGSRRLTGGIAVNAPLFREITTQIYSVVFSVFTFKRITDATNGFRAFYLDILKDPSINLNQEWLNTYELEPYLLYKAAISPHIKVIEMPITVYYHDSPKQYTKMKPFSDWWRLVRPVFLLRFGLRR
jgi:dolichol-phosphate mannosyltransferase